MAKPELGSKRTCVACATRFYDLLRAPAVCPKCATEQPAEVPRVRRAVADDRMRKRAPAAVAEAEPAEVELEEVEADETVEDAEELEDDAEELAEELEVETPRDEET